MEAEPRAARFWRASKAYEGQGSFVLWQVQIPGVGKRYLIADATQQSFGIRLQEERPEDLKTDGVLVANLRKHARTAAIGPILTHAATGDLWIPLYTRGDDTESTNSASNAEASRETITPRYWVQLTHTAPPEVRLIAAADATILARKSSQGSYTKRRTLEGALPPESALLAARRGEAEAGYAPLGLDVEGARAEPSPTEQAPAAPQETAPPPPHGSGPLLSEIQRSARDRLARRLKTVRKALAKREADKKAAGDATRLEFEATLLRDHLHLVQPGLSEVVVEDGPQRRALALDPDLSPGQNLTAYFERAKRARRAMAALAEQTRLAQNDVAALETDLARLRAGPLPAAEISALLARHKLAPSKPKTVKGEPAAAQPFKTYLYTPDDEGDSVPKTAIELKVGKGATDNDALVKQARANDLWVHAAGVTGSHVIIPARQLKGEPPPALLRMAAILALHHSKVRNDQRGEVYLTRRQHLRKRKGMPPGLWQIDKAETLFFRYDAAELEAVLARLKP